MLCSFPNKTSKRQSNGGEPKSVSRPPRVYDMNSERVWKSFSVWPSLFRLAWGPRFRL